MNGLTRSFTWCRIPERVILPCLMMIALALRLIGIHHGLPGTYDPDEPHHINVAVYFGSGDLNPHVFKYPTLWMYVLSALYGVIYLLWSGFGLLKSTKDFSHLFIWDPTVFYLSARCLAAGLGTLSLYFIYKAGREISTTGVALGAVLLCVVSPPLVYFGHIAKADMLMLFFASAAWWLCARYYQTGSMKDALFAGLSLGLAATSQYTAFFLSPLLLWAHLLRAQKGISWRKMFFSRTLILSYAFLPLIFLAGTPFALFDWRTFLHDIQDLRNNYQAGGLAPAHFGFGVLHNYGRLLSVEWLGIFVLIAGAVASLRSQRKTGLLFLGPLVWSGIFLGTRNIEAGKRINYIFPLVPGIALTMSFILTLTSRHSAFRWILGFLCGFYISTALVKSLKMDRAFLILDTRTKTKRWIESSIPKGSRILLDQVHAGPPLAINRVQVERLYEKTRALGHPRARYYQLMLESHPGGGYEIFRIQRTAAELTSMKRHTEWSQQGYDLLDVQNGLSDLRRAGIQYVVWSSAGATRQNSPRLRKFFDELEREAQLVQEFRPEPDSYSPLLRIYRL